MLISGNSSVGRARPCQGRGREFESRFPLQILESPNQTVWAFFVLEVTHFKYFKINQAKEFAKRKQSHQRR